MKKILFIFFISSLYGDLFAQVFTYNLNFVRVNLNTKQIAKDKYINFDLETGKDKYGENLAYFANEYTYEDKDALSPLRIDADENKKAVVKFEACDKLNKKLLACNGMGKDEISNFKHKDISNYYFKIDNNNYSVKILRDYNEDSLGRAIDVKECAVIVSKYKDKKWHFCYNNISMQEVSAKKDIIEFRGGNQDRLGNIVDFYMSFKYLESDFYLYEYVWKFGRIDENSDKEIFDKAEIYYKYTNEKDKIYINEVTPELLNKMREIFYKNK